MRSSQKYLDIHLAEQNKKHTFALANQQGAIAQLVEQRTENPCVPGSIPGGTTFFIRFAHFGAIAQLVEQRTENPCVPGSIPGGTTEERLQIKSPEHMFRTFYLQLVVHSYAHQQHDFSGYS